MEKIKLSLKKIIGDKYILGIFIGVILISFLLGMEFKTYQIRTALKEAFKNFGTNIQTSLP